jgi:anti-sigma regulatory factor (Ser/Thr protein kinase)
VAPKGEGRPRVGRGHRRTPTNRGPKATNVRLAGDASSAADARQFLISTLTEWSADHHLEIATLLASELVTNAVLHTRSKHVDLSVLLDGDRLRVEVADESGALPARLGGGPLAATGRGLTLVDALASGWGVDVSAIGKIVWFEVG